MKNNFLVILFLLSTLGSNVQGQPIERKTTMDLTFINNKKIKYYIGLVACDTCAPIINIGYRVVVELSEKEQEIIKKINSKTWLKLLNNDSTDYAANLILYDIYDKDALILSMYDSKELWNKYLKKDDLEHWSNLLKNNSKNTR